MATASQLGIDPEAIEAALDRNLTFPARWYSDPAIYDVELEHVFARSWQLVAKEERIPNPGDHLERRERDRAERATSIYPVATRRPRPPRRPMRGTTGPSFSTNPGQPCFAS